MKTVKEEIEDSAVEALKKSNKKLFDLIDTGIRRDGLKPAQIDKYIKVRFGLRKGHPVRDLCYLSALSIQRNVKASS